MEQSEMKVEVSSGEDGAATQGMIAKKLKLSAKTVNLALNNRAGVSIETANRVREEARRIGYTGRRRKVALRRAVGIIVPHIGQAANGELLQLLRQLAAAHDFVPFVGESGGRPDEEAGLIEEFIAGGANGFFLISPRIHNERINEFVRRKIPVVTINRAIIGKKDENECIFGSVELHGGDGAIQAAEYLVACGCKRIAYLAGPMPSHSEQQRRYGYKTALESCEIQFDEHLVVEIEMPRTPPWASLEAGYKQCQTLIARGVKFDSILAFNDEVAIGAMAALNECGKEIPKDVCIIGCDNIRMGRFVSPKLTTIGIQREKTAWSAMEILWEMWDEEEGVSPGRKIALRPSIIRRESCREMIR